MRPISQNVAGGMFPASRPYTGFKRMLIKHKSTSLIQSPLRTNSPKKMRQELKAQLNLTLNHFLNDIIEKNSRPKSAIQRYAGSVSPYRCPALKESKPQSDNPIEPVCGKKLTFTSPKKSKAIVLPRMALENIDIEKAIAKLCNLYLTAHNFDT